MSKRDRSKKASSRREAENIRKENESMIKRLNKDRVVKRSYRRNLKKENVL